MAARYIHTCYRILEPEKSMGFYVNKMASCSKSAKFPELQFRTLLAENGTERLELARA